VVGRRTAKTFDGPQQRQAGGLRIRSDTFDGAVRKGDFRPADADAVGPKKIGTGEREIVDDLAFSENLELHSNVLTLYLWSLDTREHLRETPVAL
jgi:hypothetical protein